MPTPYHFIWLSAGGDVAAIDSVKCFGDADALRAAHALFREDDVSRKWPSCQRIETYAGARFIKQVQRTRTLGGEGDAGI